MRTTPARRTSVLLAALLAVVAWGCGGRPTAFVSTASPPATAAPPTTEAGLRLTDADNGRTATATVGERITVVLASTFWQVAPPTENHVLAQAGPPEVTAGGQTCPPIPGNGCGTVAASFLALAPGGADVAANRSSCGEALRCTEDLAHWRVHIEVGGPEPTTPAPPPPTVTTLARLTTAPTVTPTTTKVVSASGVEGTVVFSPACPVERVPPDPQCVPRPGPADVHLVRTDNGALLSGQAGADGRFSISAAPGTYVVEVVATSPGPGRGCQAQPPQVTVVAGSFAPVTVSCDTGIR